MTSLWSLSLLAFASLTTAAGLSPEFGSRAVKATTHIPPASHAIRLATKVTRPPSKRNTHTNSCEPQAISSLGGTLGNQAYSINATIGGQNFVLVLDTGSSNLWVPTTNFSCFDLTDQPVPPAECAFGSSTFDPARSETFKPYNDKNFNISYSDGEFLTGTVGFDTVNIGGLEVSNQEFGLVNRAAWIGDNITSGLLGLAGPGFTRVFNGTDPNKDRKADYQTYNPFFYNAVANNKSKPYFSMSLNRPRSNSSGFDPDLGLIAFGGVVPVATRSPHVTVPSLKVQSEYGSSGYALYAPQVDGYKFPGSTSLKTASNRTVLDSGTTLNYFPSAIAKEYNAQFTPPANISDKYGLYVVVCSAKIPDFQVIIGGKSFDIDPRDQLSPIGVKNDQGEDLCISSTQDGGGLAVFVLGTPFLHNVVTTYNIQEETITLSQRAKY